MEGIRATSSYIPTLAKWVIQYIWVIEVYHIWRAAAALNKRQSKKSFFWSYGKHISIDILTIEIRVCSLQAISIPKWS